MANKAIQQLTPWEDCWRQPELDELLDHLNDPHVKPFTTLMSKLEEFEELEMHIADHGVSWHWTLVYRLPAMESRGDGMDQFAYFVPNPAGALVCVPMTTQMITSLPLRRLNRYIREGIRVAKCAVDIHWCIWTPTAMTEVEHLYDLFKRKYRMLMQNSKAEEAEEAAEAKAPAAKKSAASKTSKTTKKKAAKTTKTTKAAKVSKKKVVKKTVAKKTASKAKTTKKKVAKSSARKKK